MKAADNEARDDEYVQAFARLAQERLSGEAPARDRDQAFERLQARMNASEQPRVATWSRVAGVALAAVVVLGAGTWLVARNRSITYEVDNSQVAADGKLFGGSSGSQVSFSDGSKLALWPGAQASVGELDAHGGHVRIEEGTTHVAIAHKPGAAWSLLAGPYTVRVTGTAFDIGWVASAQRFDITMRSGSVVITGPLAPRGVTLVAGQRMKADRDLLLGRAGEELSAALPAPEPEPTPEPAEEAAEPAESAAPSSLEPARRAGVRGPSWRALVASGKFATVLTEAERRGVASVLSSSKLEDLSAFADAARYARRSDLAQRALLAQRQRFPRSSQARDAAFFLGTLSEGQGANAMNWYDHYLQESPSGAYASQALGRKLMVVYGQHRSQEAHKLAAEYAARYPKGPYASTARKVLAEPIGGTASGKATGP